MRNILVITILLSCLYSCNKNLKEPVKEISTVSSAKVTKAVHTVISGEVKRGQGLYQALKNVSIDNSLAHKLINELRDDVEFSKLKVGDKLKATFDENKKLISFSFSQNFAESHILTLDKEKNKWNYSLNTLKTFWEPRILEGELRSDSTLENDLISTGLNRSVVNEVVNVLLCKVNFRMNARQGDKYSVLLSERKHEDKLIETKVLFTSYSGVRAGTHEAFYYEDDKAGSTYNAHYTKNGQALISSGLRYPLSRLHVRSSFGWRRHPVTGKRAMHRGVDLRGKRGAKVYAVAAGKVVMSTYNKFAGNKIGIRHRDGSTSYYYHLSKRGVNKGAWVRSHQVIGRVGSTGRVTGPHLHFGFKRPNGKWMNPLNKRMIATPKLAGKRFEKLTSQIEEIEGILADLKLDEESNYLVADLKGIKRFPSAIEYLDNISRFGLDLENIL